MIASASLAICGCSLYDESLLKEDVGHASAPGSIAGEQAVASGGSSGASAPAAGGGPTAGVGGASSAQLGGANAAGGTAGNATAGSGEEGGQAGAAGSGPGPSLEVLLDNFEDGDTLVTGVGYFGQWYSFADEAAGGSFTPSPISTITLDAANVMNPASLQAIRLAGKYGGWGIGLGVAVAPPDKTTFDASGFTGISFWAKLGETAFPQLVISVADPRCDGCINPPERLLTMTTEWVKYYLPFDSFHQSGIPTFDTPNPATVGPIQFRVRGDQQLDLWMDDLAFYAD